MKKENVKVKAKATKSTTLFKNSFVTFGKVQKAAWQYKKPRGIVTQIIWYSCFLENLAPY